MVTALGGDNFAFREGSHDGSVLVDMLTHQPVHALFTGVQFAGEASFSGARFAGVTFDNYARFNDADSVGPPGSGARNSVLVWCSPSRRSPATPGFDDVRFEGWIEFDKAEFARRGLSGGA